MRVHRFAEPPEGEGLGLCPGDRHSLWRYGGPSRLAALGAAHLHFANPLTFVAPVLTRATRFSGDLRSARPCARAVPREGRASGVHPASRAAGPGARCLRSGDLVIAPTAAIAASP